MAKEGTLFEEATGIFVGTLMEDMIKTVERTHKLYCDVYIPEFFAEQYDHPLTYVPLWAMSLPLKEGDKVLVEFHQGDLRLPVLYKNPDEIDSQFYEKFEFDDFVKGTKGGNVNKPEAKDTVGATKLGEDSYIIKTDDYTVLHQNNGFVLIDKDDKVYVYGKEINIVSSGTTNIDSSKEINVFCDNDINVETTSNVSIKTNTYSTGKVSIETTNGNVEINAGGTGSVSISGTTGVTVNNHLKVM